MTNHIWRLYKIAHKQFFFYYILGYIYQIDKANNAHYHDNISIISNINFHQD